MGAGTIYFVDTQINNDEISLRELYLVLKRWRGLVFGLPILAALIALAVSVVLPKKYQSVGTYSLNLISDKLAAPLSNLPVLNGLVQGFSDDLKLSETELGQDAPDKVFMTKFDDKKNLWVLTGMGSNPQLAQQRAEKLMMISKNYLEDQVNESVRFNIKAVIEQSRVDLSIAEQSLSRIQTTIQNAGIPVQNRNPVTTASLETQGVVASSARSSNPALVSLSLEQSRLQIQRLNAQTRVQVWTDLLQNPARLRTFIGQALSVQAITMPSLSQIPTEPRILLNTALGFVVGLLFGLLIPFLIEAIREPLRSESVSVTA